jgi:hypothetical protein
MYDLLLVNLQVSLNDLVHEAKHLLFSRLGLDFFVEITWTQLGDYVRVIFGRVNLM